ncbi:MAG: CPBP family intramembrane metalloprotease [Candidatus Eremiobacteraeota bacterium]|nr:CPBP family intramembrane metalloprotease [Candidatus Eremiobacteraeota bacterium]
MAGWFLYLALYGFRYGGLSVPVAIFVSYNLTLTMPLAAITIFNFKGFKKLVVGDLTVKQIIVLGVVPCLLWWLAQLMIAVAFSSSSHTPLHDYFFRGDTVAPLIFLIPTAPFVEEMIFHVWLQTRLQQYLGLAGAIIAGAIFFGYHFTSDLMLVPIITIWTWLRYRFKSLGVTLISHYVYDLMTVATNLIIFQHVR